MWFVVSVLWLESVEKFSCGSGGTLLLLCLLLLFFYFFIALGTFTFELLNNFWCT